MRGMGVAALVVALTVPASVGRAEQRDYRAAVRAFDAELTLPERMRLQVRLIAGGYTNGVPTEHLGPRAFEGIKAFQYATGFEPTGRFTNPAAARLRDETQPIMALWGFGWIEHPSRPLRMWAPLALLGAAVPTRYGAHYEDGAKRLELDVLSYPATDARFSYEDSLRDWQRRGVLVNYHFFADKEWPSWWVASTTTPDGHDHYYRYHQDGDAVTGFALEWDNAAGDVHGERIAVILSGAVRSTMANEYFPDPPAFSGMAQAQPPLRPVVVPVAPSPDPSRPEPPKNSGSSGTGFFVSTQGHLVTNAHVVKDCGSIEVKASDGVRISASKLAADERNDLALLRVEIGASPPRVAALRAGVRLGEGVEAFGFPHIGLLASAGNFTTGSVAALSGINDDSGFLQVSAPVQSGNSGGPLLDQSGNVVGVVTAKLDALKVMLASDDLPQNVNFAIKASRVAEFLGSNGVGFATGGVGAALPPADIAEQPQAMSAVVM